MAEQQRLWQRKVVYFLLARVHSLVAQWSAALASRPFPQVPPPRRFTARASPRDEHICRQRKAFSYQKHLQLRILLVRLLVRVALRALRWPPLQQLNLQLLQRLSRKSVCAFHGRCANAWPHDGAPMPGRCFR